ncbi:hypothetical protein [Frisingicoccus sp.]|uniref:hypothetical protein n=1 Tax=Frisingicoccus sp. TaxID=1918627 RepID=UPI0038690C52
MNKVENLLKSWKEKGYTIGQVEAECDRLEFDLFTLHEKGRIDFDEFTTERNKLIAALKQYK